MNFHNSKLLKQRTLSSLYLENGGAMSNLRNVKKKLELYAISKFYLYATAFQSVRVLSRMAIISHWWATNGLKIFAYLFLYTIYTSALTSDSSYQIPFNLSLISKLLCETPAKHLGRTGLGVMIVLLQAIWNCYCRAISMKIEGPVSCSFKNKMN